MVALAPIVAPFFTRVCLNSFLFETALRGLIILVNTHEGPRKTSSSQITPSYSETLFCTFTWLPNTTVDAIKTFWPMLQLFPMRQPFIRCEKCQMLVPLPIIAPSSITAVGCTKKICCIISFNNAILPIFCAYGTLEVNLNNSFCFQNPNGPFTASLLKPLRISKFLGNHNPIHAAVKDADANSSKSCS